MAAGLAVGIILVPTIRVAVSYVVPVVFFISFLSFNADAARERNWKPSEPLPNSPHLAFEMMQIRGRHAAQRDDMAITNCLVMTVLLLLWVLSVVGLFLGWNHSWLFTLLGAGLGCFHPLLKLLP